MDSGKKRLALELVAGLGRERLRGLQAGRKQPPVTGHLFGGFVSGLGASGRSAIQPASGISKMVRQDTPRWRDRLTVHKTVLPNDVWIAAPEPALAIAFNGHHSHFDELGRPSSGSEVSSRIGENAKRLEKKVVLHSRTATVAAGICSVRSAVRPPGC